LASVRFRVIIEPKAEEVLSKLDPQTQTKLRLAIGLLASNPYPPNCRKLINQVGYRVRVGDYRVIYQVEGKNLLVYVFKLGHRREIYVG
jgi:mRNA interferase RelE/StbE